LIWSRSGKRLIVSVFERLGGGVQQIKLTPEQIEELIDSLTKT
jgi:hypothetical protein